MNEAAKVELPQDTPIGTRVRVHRHDDREFDTVTRTLPFQNVNGTWVVTVEVVDSSGQSQDCCFALASVEALPA